MKILVVSLLRLGDFIQILPVVNGLRRQFPGGELDLLTFTPAQQLAPMITGVSKWWTLNREDLQQGLGNIDIPLLTSFSVLQEQLDLVNAREYDLVINLTQTDFSAWICGYINTPSRAGLMRDVKGAAQFHSGWFQYLNDHAALSVPDIFHYSDIFYFGSGLKNGERDWSMTESVRGRREAAALGIGAGEQIVLQLLTSDEKKNWSTESWLQMLRQLQVFRPAAQFILLGAPSEEAHLEEVYHRAEARGLNVIEAILSLEGAFSLLKTADVLISGDTSIKHLANCAGTPVIELSLGSSDYRRTGAYTADSLLLQPRIACTPCPHSSACSQSTHKCAEQLSPSAVSLSVHHYLNKDWAQLKQLAAELNQEVNWLRTHITGSGFWLAINILESQAMRLVDTLVERSAWKFFLNRDHLNSLAEYGSEGTRIKSEIEIHLAAADMTDMRQHLSFLESRAENISEKASALIEGVKKRTPSIAEIRDFITAHQPDAESLPWLEQLRSQVPRTVVEIGGLRRVHNHLERCRSQAQVKTKLIRCLKTQLTESK